MGSMKNAGAFVVVLVASFTVMNGLPVDGLRSACGQELVLAFVALAGVGLACPEVLVKRCTHDAQHVRTVCEHGGGVPIRAQVRAGNAIRPGHGCALR